MEKMALLGVAALGLFVMLTGCASSLVGLDSGAKTSNEMTAPGALQGQGLYGVVINAGNSVTGSLYGNNSMTWGDQDWYHVGGIVYGNTLSVQFTSNENLDVCIWVSHKYSSCDLKPYIGPKSLSTFVTDPNDVWIWVGVWRQSSGSYKLVLSK